MSPSPTTHTQKTAVRNSDVAVHVHNLQVVRGKREVLRVQELTISRGQIVGLLGPSGSGKTTLLRSLVGSQIVQQGNISVLGRAAGSASLRSQVGYVTQNPSIYLDLSVQHNIEYFAALYHKPRIAVHSALAAVDLTDHRKQLARDLSGGQLTRVSLACALVGDPELLVLDEPTVGLDPVLRVQLWKQFHQLAAQGKTLIVSSHVMDEAHHCDELILLRQGAVIAQLSPSQLRVRTGQNQLENALLQLIQEYTKPSHPPRKAGDS